MLRMLRSFMVFAEQLALLEEVSMAVRRVITHALLTLLAVLLVFAGSACGATSLWLWADARYGRVTAPLIVMGALLLLAVLILASMALSRLAVRKSRKDRASRAVQELANAPNRLLNLAAEGFLAGLAGTRSKGA